MSNILFTKSTLVVFLAVLSPVVYAQEKQPRVRAKEPTVVTVEGKKESVREDQRPAEAEKDDNVFSRMVHGVGRGVAAVGHGIGRWISGMGESDEVVPSAEERRRAGERKKQ